MEIMNKEEDDESDDNLDADDNSTDIDDMVINTWSRKHCINPS